MVVTDIDPAEWDAFVDQHPRSTTYHRWKWRTVFGDVFGHECHYLAVRSAETLAGVLPLVLMKSLLFGRFAVSLPFVNYGGILTTSGGAVEELVSHASQLLAACDLKHVELRHTERLSPQLPVKRHKVAMRRTLPTSIDEVWKSFDKKVRNQIRKAEKSDLTAEIGGAELVAPFYDVFAQNMRDLGTPVYPRSLFETVVREFPDSTQVHIVRLKGDPIAGGISHAFRDTVELPWASSLRKHLSRCPNHLLYWSAIQHAVASGQHTFDFGRSTPGEGTYKFKQQWGAEASPLYWEYALARHTSLPDQSPKNPKLQIAIAAWKRLPVGVATTLGPYIVRGIP